jgi:hypothetical protein
MNQNQPKLSTLIIALVTSLHPANMRNSIVAVHGLNPKSDADHAERSWTKNGKLWLKDFLPNRIPEARVLLFSYNSNVIFDTADDTISQESINLLDRLRFKRKVKDTILC